MEIETLLRESDPARQTRLPPPDQLLGWSIRSQGAPSPQVRFRLAAVVVFVIATAAIVAAVLPGTSSQSQSAATTALDRLATLTDHQAISAKPGEYYYTEIERQLAVSSGSLVAGGPTVNTYEAGTVQTWVAPNGSGRQVSTSDLTPRFPTSADRSAWVAAGRSLRPLFTVPPTVHQFGAGYAFTDNPIIRIFDISHLPTDIDTLTSVITQGHLEVTKTEQTELKGLGPVSNCATKACGLFERVAILLQGPDVGGTPARRAALFKVMAHVPGVKLLGSVVDPSGRRGTGLEVTQHYPAETITCNKVKIREPGSSTTEEVVIDSKTATLLSTETKYSPRVVTRHESQCRFSPAAGTYPITPHWTLLLHSGVVSSDSKVPR